LTTFDDVRHASRHPEISSSIPTSTSLNDVRAEIAECVGSMVSLDDPVICGCGRL
jgi:methyl-branched lipid omega-hydroxylase